MQCAVGTTTTTEDSGYGIDRMINQILVE